MESFLHELYELDVQDTEEAVIDLERKLHNVPEICIEIDMQKLQFRHSIYGPKIFEICGYILYSAKVFPKCLNQMN